MHFMRTFSTVACHRARSGFAILKHVKGESVAPIELSLSCQAVWLRNDYSKGQRNTTQRQEDLSSELHSFSRDTVENNLGIVTLLKDQEAETSHRTCGGEARVEQTHRGKKLQFARRGDARHFIKKGLLETNTHLLSHRTNSNLYFQLLVRNLSTINSSAAGVQPERQSIVPHISEGDTGPSHTRVPNDHINKKVDIQKIMADEDEWITAGQHRIHAWTVSGLESCIVAKIEGMDIAFDMGYATRPAIKCEHVFISHGHIDHVAAIVKHAAHRSLFSLKPAVYYVPPHLEEPLQRLGAAYSDLHGGDEDFCDLKIKTISPGETLHISKKTSVKAFPTLHRVPSQGYIVYCTKRVLKPEYVGITGPEIGQLVKEGVEVHDHLTVPELAYTGDTTFEVFLNPPTPDLLRVSTLITEATYIDDEWDRLGRGGVERAAARGHCHLQQLVDNQDLFDQVNNIVLVHFSDKYSVRYIRKKTDELLTEGLRQKVSLGITMKQTLG